MDIGTKALEAVKRDVEKDINDVLKKKMPKGASMSVTVEHKTDNKERDRLMRDEGLDIATATIRAQVHKVKNARLTIPLSNSLKSALEDVLSDARLKNILSIRATTDGKNATDVKVCNSSEYDDNKAQGK